MSDETDAYQALRNERDAMKIEIGNLRAKLAGQAGLLAAKKSEAAGPVHELAEAIGVFEESISGYPYEMSMTARAVLLLARATLLKR